MIVFLKVDWTDPTTLYYHLAEPGAEVLAHPDNFRYCTAVGQVLAFSLMALGPPASRRQHGQEERRLATESLKRWDEDCETILRSITVSERKPLLDSPAFKPTTYMTVDRSPYFLRQNKNKSWTAGTNHPNARGNRSSEPSDDESRPRMPDTPSPAQPRSRGQRSQRGLAQRPRGDSGQNSSSRDGGNGGGGGGGGGDRQYCTQKCLVGLVRGRLLDVKCPNATLHRGQNGSRVRHPVDHATWLRLLREQLRETLDDGVTRIGKQGARGVLFQVTLLAHGYTFVSKGTVPEFVGHLQHEAAVYQRLGPLHGICVPVFLGAVDLRDIGRVHHYDFRVRIVHMIFLAWAGNDLNEVGTSEAAQRDLSRGLVRSVRSLHAMGVAHMDVWKPNALWSREAGRVMVIDFERAVLMDPPQPSPSPRPPLAQVVPNKKARAAEGVGCGKAVGQTSHKVERDRQVWDDISAARSIFKLQKCAHSPCTLYVH